MKAQFMLKPLAFALAAVLSAGVYADQGGDLQRLAALRLQQGLGVIDLALKTGAHVVQPVDGGGGGVWSQSGLEAAPGAMAGRQCPCSGPSCCGSATTATAASSRHGCRGRCCG